MNEKILLDHMKDIFDIFERCGIPIWLEAGALLGAIREGRLLSWDKDIDLGTLEQTIRSDRVKYKLTKKFSKKGYFILFFDRVAHVIKDQITTDILINRIDEKTNGGVCKMWFHRNALGKNLIRINKLCNLDYFGGPVLNFSTGMRNFFKINFFFLVNLIPKWIRLSTYKAISFILSPFGGYDMYYLKVSPDHFLKLKRIKFEGVKIKIPSNPEKYLEGIYGDWRKPPKDPKKWLWIEHGGWKLG